MDTGGREVDTTKGHYRAVDLLDDCDNLRWTQSYLCTPQNKKAAICVIARVMDTYFVIPGRTGSSDDIPRRQELWFKVLRPADQEALEKLLYGMRSPPEGTIELSIAVLNSDSVSEYAVAPRKRFKVGRFTSDRKSPNQVCLKNMTLLRMI